MVLDRTSIPRSVNLGLTSLKDSRREVISKSLCDRLDGSLYKFFLARVGLRFLTEHHIACDPHEDTGRGGLIDNKCDPIIEAEKVIEDIEDQCQEEVRLEEERSDSKSIIPPFYLTNNLQLVASLVASPIIPTLFAICFAHRSLAYAHPSPL